MSVDQKTQAAHLDSFFIALADPSRRDMLRLLLQKPPRAGELAENVDMTPQALSRHLKTLRLAGVIKEDGIAADARVLILSVPDQAFEPVQHWVSQAEELWRRQLSAFKAFADTLHRSRKPESVRMISLWWGEQLTSLRRICLPSR